MRSKARLSARLLVVVSGLSVGLVAAEIGLRVAGFHYPNLYREDASVGYTLRPRAEGWWTREGRTYIKISSAGWRDREHAREKPTGTLRVAVLGDSFAEALQVPLESAFWSVAERETQASCAALGGRKVEFINFGVSGFSTARELITLRERVWQYEPDVVLLLFTTSNDVRDNSRALSAKYDGLPLPYFVYRDDGALVLDDSFLRRRNESLAFRLRQSSAGRALDWLDGHVRLLGLVAAARAAFESYRLGSQAAKGAGHEPGADAAVYLEPRGGEWAEAWRVTEGLLRATRDEVRSHGAKFLVVTGSSGIQVYPDQDVRERFARTLGTDDLLYPDWRIKSFGEREGVDVLTLAPALREYAERNQTFLHGTDGFGHWNALGHRLAGEMIARKLCETAAAN